ncbi:hypothetical protein M427DRAFT_140260 [Gonapodya prolifera JEL478]|uniref:Uncharacterized protein n=1 Tax=Gonapodya prolifera (strain JEL478) TaxID=1344416 RepID=A0A138ZZK3_GONPJ|nr:hypothetical protein M427DRAFT_140260 [Gonapodya prolifera JEL478]|eukprot:KXS09936.1 hypothetical protein M427DRAFT_140260 [Gonapodya prolifera JEL478]
MDSDVKGKGEYLRDHGGTFNAGSSAGLKSRKFEREGVDRKPKDAPDRTSGNADGTTLREKKKKEGKHLKKKDDDQHPPPPPQGFWKPA